MKQPTIARMVHYFPNSPEGQNTHPIPLPRICAAIVNDEDEYPTLTVLTGNPEMPMIVVKTVTPADKKVDDKPYWDWPEIK